jgi:hypothetical protein
MSDTNTQAPEAGQIPEPTYEPVKGEKPSRRGLIVTAAACGVAAFALAGAGVIAYNANQDVAAAHKKELAAENKPPQIVTKTRTETVTKIVPSFGKSTIMGLYANGQILAAGVYVSNNDVQDFTPSDGTCSSKYAELSAGYSAIAIDRTAFMQACLTSVTMTLKSNKAP